MCSEQWVGFMIDFELRPEDDDEGVKVANATALVPRRWLWLKGMGLFWLFVGLMVYIQTGALTIPDTDGYYHIKMGWLIRQEGIKPDFPWLPLTILNEEAYTNHHLLYHLYLALFATTDPVVDGGAALVRGAKVATVLLPALAFVAVWWLLQGQKVPAAAAFALALFALSSAFLFRMNMVRAQSLSLLLLVLALHWLLQGRYGWLIPLGFVYVWAYNAFPLLLVVAGLYAAATLLLERRLVWQAVVYPLIGISLGLIINPYFPQNISFILSHLGPKIGGLETPVGNEWYPYETWTLVQNSGYALLAFVLGALAWGWQEKRPDKAIFIAFGLAVFFAFLLFKSRRFVEYFPAFALIFLAFAAAPILTAWKVQRPRLAPYLPVILLALLLWPVYQTVREARLSLGSTRPPDLYAAAALWLHEEAPPGAMVFQTDWDDFTRLFFYNHRLIYTVGLDPTYLELADAERYQLWVEITRGRVPHPGQIIGEQFAAAYVFSDLEHRAFMNQAATDPYLQEIYRDQYAVIYAVLSPIRQPE